MNIKFLDIPQSCPCCGEPLEIRIDDHSGVETLYCNNENCEARGSRKFKHFVSRDAMNIDGMSGATLDKFVEYGMLNSFSDIYKLKRYAYDIMEMDGFGQKSCEKMLEAIEKSRSVKPANLIYALSIPNVGLSTAKLICKHFKNNISKIVTASFGELSNIDGVGDVIAGNFTDYFLNENNREEFKKLYREIRIDENTGNEKTSNLMNGITICVTGDVYVFKNRRVIKDLVENLGGSLTGSVSRSTTYLVTNDTTSGSRKNKAAQEYGIPILTEHEFIDKFNLSKYI